MTIAIDYDGTYDRCPEIWRKFISTASMNSSEFVEVVCVTARPECCPVDFPYGKVYYTSGSKKRDYMRCQGVSVDVWIDDRPEDI